jgi:hypothetical protein
MMGDAPFYNFNGQEYALRWDDIPASGVLSAPQILQLPRFSHEARKS